MLARRAPVFDEAIGNEVRRERHRPVCVHSTPSAPDRLAGRAKPARPKLDAPESTPVTLSIPVTDEAPVADEVTFFSPLELLVISIGDRDPITSVRPGSRLAQLRQWLFGIEAPRPFADRRLEALRSLAIALRRRRGPDAEVAAALAAGLTSQQIAHLRLRRP